MQGAAQVDAGQGVVVAEMPLYQSHKRVHALKIKELVGDGYTLRFEQVEFADKPVAPALFARYTPVPGDYYVVYEDGYESISPAKAFDAGYNRVLPETLIKAAGFNPLSRLRPGEPFFVLRGQDQLASSVIRIWATDAESNGCPPAKVHDARGIAVRMDNWPFRKLPD
jgi:hypothetical protein